jgi:drug/metabolite transporter (DMT)-like permease
MKSLVKYLIPFTGAIAEAAGTIYEKTILRKKKVDYRDYNVFSFLSITILTIVAIFFLGKILPEFFAFKVSLEALELKNILLMVGVIIFSILANLTLFYATKWEKITEIEPIRLLQPLFTIVLAFLIFPSERQTGNNILIASLVASLALIFAHIRKHHLKINKYAIAALLASLFFAIELIISKAILIFYTPITFYLIRCFFIFLITLIIFRPNFKSENKKVWKSIIITGGIWVLYRILLYSGYVHAGVIVTTLLLSLVTPIFIYIFSYIYLKERPSKRNILAAIIILACVTYAIITNGL